MLECPICHINNDDQARFCTECGHRFPYQGNPNTQAPPGSPSSITAIAPKANSAPSNSPSLPNSPSAPSYMDNNNSQPGQPIPDQTPVKRPRLHSPILGGDDPDDDSYNQSSFDAPTQKKAKGGLLRSPLLGGGGGGGNNIYDGDDEPKLPRPVKSGAKPAGGKTSHLRSPLLGGSADDEDDYEEDFPLRDKRSNSDKSAFPHRSHTPLIDAPEPAPGSQTGSRPHLRSPLLQGDDEFDEPGADYGHAPQQPKQAPAARSGKLNSPLFGKHADGGYGYVEEEDSYPTNENPNALRSPLLAARSPVTPHEDQRDQKIAANQTHRSATPQPSLPEPMPTPVPAPQLATPSLPVPPRPMTTQPPALGTPLPMTPAIPRDLAEEDHSQQDPFAWRDRGFPNASTPVETGFGDTGFGAAGFDTPGMPKPMAPLPMPTGLPTPEVIKPSATQAKFEHQDDSAKLKSPPMRSKMFGGGANDHTSPNSYDDNYADDYAEHAPGRKRFGDATSGSKSARNGDQSGPIMILLVPVILVLLGKAYYLFALASANQLLDSVPLMADQFGQFLLLVALLVFSFTGNKR